MPSPKRPRKTSKKIEQSSGQPLDSLNADAAPEHGDIAKLAFEFWEQRGRPVGSPEQDWLRAEKEVKRRAAASRRKSRRSGADNS
jgi:hypothetical protein